MEKTAARAVLTIKEAAGHFGFPEYGLRSLVKRGAFPVIMCGNRAYISRAVLEAFFERGGEALGARR